MQLLRACLFSLGICVSASWAFSANALPVNVSDEISVNGNLFSIAELNTKGPEAAFDTGLNSLVTNVAVELTEPGSGLVSDVLYIDDSTNHIIFQSDGEGSNPAELVAQIPKGQIPTTTFFAR